MKKTILRTNQNDPQIKAYKEAVEKGKKSQHVVPKESGWAVISGSIEKQADTFGTQQEAIERAKFVARSSGASVYIHGVDGRIRAAESYANDSFPPRDTEH